MDDDIYKALGIRETINAEGPLTRLGGAVMAPEVAAAMGRAALSPVDIPELQSQASKIIAEFTGAEAGIVTSGASAGLLLGVAACVAGFDPVKMGRLPDTTGMKNEVVMARGHRNSYDHAIRAAGVTLVEAGVSDRLGGSGVRDVEAWEIESAITEQTAAVFYLARPHSRPALSEVIAVAHEAGVPVLVDAAAELPPVSNLRHFISAGADLVAFSGGKAIGGPSASGILCGRRQLIGSALLQQLDLDYQFDEWQPPRDLIATNELRGLPRHGIGRTCKVGKEQIAGLLTALKLFASEDDTARGERLMEISRRLIAGLNRIAALDTEIIVDSDRAGMPTVQLRLKQGNSTMTVRGLAQRLQEGTPRIRADTSRRDDGILLLVPDCLKNGEPEVIVRRLREIFDVAQ